MKQRNIIRTDAPDARQIRDIRELTGLCQKLDHTHISCPLDPEEGACHFLFYAVCGTVSHAPALLGICSVVPYDENTAECIAFTHPHVRKQGIFTELLSQAMELFGELDILFPVSEHCPDALAALKAIGAEPNCEEYQMELELHPETRAEKEPMLSSHTDPQSGLTHWNLHAVSDAGTLLGACQTSVIGDHCICLHHVEVPTEFRGKGYGTILLQALICSLQSSGIRHILLQVSGDNLPALALYRKQGFRITETLSFYLY